MQYREVPWQIDYVHYPELVQDLIDIGLLAAGCVVLDGGTDVTPIPLLVDREATTVVEVSEFHRTPAIRVRTVLRNGFLVETKLRWETMPPWPERMEKARKLTDVETEMTRNAASGRSVLVAVGPPEEILAQHHDHVTQVARAQRTTPRELNTMDEAVEILNTALEHDRQVAEAPQRVVDQAQTAAFVVAVLLVCAGYVTGRWWPVALTPVLVAATWYASPYLLVLLGTSHRLRPAFPWTHAEQDRPLRAAG